MKKLIFIVVSVLLLSCLYSKNLYFKGDVYKEGSTDFKTVSKILDVAYDDIDNDNFNETFILLGENPFDSSVYTENIKLVVKTQNGKTTIYDNFIDSGYVTEFFIEDFDGDGLKDIFIKNSTGGSGNYSNFSVFSLENNKIKFIMKSDDMNKLIKCEGYYEDNFKVKISFEQVNEDIILNLYGKKKKYIENNIYDLKGNFLLEDNSLMIAGIQKVEPVFLYKYGYYGLKCSKRISGFCHADAVSDVNYMVVNNNNKMDIVYLDFSTIVIE